MIWILLAFFGSTFALEDTRPINAKANYHFVISAKSGTLEKDHLVLDQVPFAIFFSERPKRIAGHLSLQHYAALCSKTMKANLAIEKEGKIHNIGVELKDPIIENRRIIYSIEPLEGQSVEFGAATLFVDPFRISQQR